MEIITATILAGLTCLIGQDAPHLIETVEISMVDGGYAVQVDDDVQPLLDRAATDGAVCAADAQYAAKKAQAQRWAAQMVADSIFGGRTSAEIVADYNTLDFGPSTTLAEIHKTLLGN